MSEAAQTETAPPPAETGAQNASPGSAGLIPRPGTAKAKNAKAAKVEAPPSPPAATDEIARLDADVTDIKLSVQALAEGFDGMKSLIGDLSGLLKGMRAQDHPGAAPRVPRPETANEVAKDPSLVRYEPVVVSADPAADVRDAIESARKVQDVNDPVFMDKMVRLKFDNEPVTFRIGTDASPVADKQVTIGLNGKTYTFERGQQYTRKRCVVGVLIAAKARKIKYNEETNRKGWLESHYPSEDAGRYTIQIVEDPSGIANNTPGGRWFMQLTRQA